MERAVSATYPFIAKLRSRNTEANHVETIVADDRLRSDSSNRNRHFLSDTRKLGPNHPSVTAIRSRASVEMVHFRRIDCVGWGSRDFFAGQDVLGTNALIFAVVKSRSH